MGAKSFWSARATGSLWSVLHCWTADWAAKSTSVYRKVKKRFFWHNFGECLVNETNSLWCVSAGNKNAFAFFSYTPLRNCFSTLQLFLKPSTATNFNQKTTWGVRWQPQAFISTCETNSETWFSFKFLNVGNKPILIKLVFVLFS